jgi:hypothetical protein
MDRLALVLSEVAGDWALIEVGKNMPGMVQVERFAEVSDFVDPGPSEVSGWDTHLDTRLRTIRPEQWRYWPSKTPSKPPRECDTSSLLLLISIAPARRSSLWLVIYPCIALRHVEQGVWELAMLPVTPAPS